MWKRVLIMACVAVCTACGSTQGGNAPGSSGSTSTPAPTAVNLAPFPAAVLKACKGVNTTTPLSKVPSACQTLWTPYGVSDVPPMNLFDHLPQVPNVTNNTNGTISNSTARSWSVALFRGQALWQWAERYDQVAFFQRIASPSELPQSEATLLGSGISIVDPNCDLFASSLKLEPISAADASFFEVISGMTTTAKYAFVATLDAPSNGNCVTYGIDQSGKKSDYFSFSSPVVLLEAGHFRRDSVLGVIWNSDADTNCNVAANSSLVTPPPGWCN